MGMEVNKIGFYINKRAFKIACVLGFLLLYFVLPKNSLAATTLQKPPLQNLGLVGYWTFNGSDYNGASTTAEVLDRSGQGNNGDAIGGPTRITGKLGQALSFDGTDDYVNVPDPASGVLDFGTATNFTLSAWVNVPSANPDQMFFSKTEFNNSPPGFYFHHSNFADSSYTVRVGLDTAAGYCVIRGSTNIADNNWHHVTGVVFRRASCTTSDILIYVDGVLQSGAVILDTNNSNSDLSSSEPLRIGAAEDSGVLSYNQVKLDEVRIYNRALLGNEVLKLYNSGAVKINSSQNSRLTNGLVGLWSFNGADYNAASTTAEVLDRSGQGNNGDAQNGPTRTIGKLGQALKFDGINDHVNLGTGSSLNITGPISVSVWIKVSALSSEQFIVDKWTWAGDNYRAWSLDFGGATAQPNLLAFRTSVDGTDGGVSEVNYDFTGNTNKWVYVAGVYNGTNLYLYIDGVQVNSAAGSVSIFSTNQPAYIGGGNTGTTNPFSGSMDEIRIYDRALSASEIKQLYNMGR